MADKSDEQIFEGQIASSGCAIGRIVLRPARSYAEDIQCAPKQERSRMQKAIGMARIQLESLKTTTHKLGANILEFELALLDDNQLTDPVYERIERGQSACEAWRVELDTQIDDYRISDDEMFRSRANDFVDLRDRVLSILHNAGDIPPACAPGAILASDELTPSRFLETDWKCYVGVAVARGSAASHVAMLARAQRVPMLFGLGNQMNKIADDSSAILDAETGRLIQFPGPQTIDYYKQIIKRRKESAKQLEQYLSRPAATAAGEPVQVLINVDDLQHIEAMDPSFCDGVGLVRTELLFAGLEKLPNEEEQYQTYVKMLQWAGDRPVTIRTLDAGGDKPIQGLTIDGESNPFLGLRGIRLSLTRTDVFNSQLRALMRAAVHGDLKVMLPMVTDPAELNQTRKIMSAQLQDLQEQGVRASMPLLGIMVEVPATALRVHAFQADFFSIGSNDLIQYVTAASRSCKELATLQDPQNPAVLELIRRVVVYGSAAGKEVSLCGDMAAETDLVKTLLDSGLKSFSVPPAALAQIKQAISHYGGKGEKSYR